MTTKTLFIVAGYRGVGKSTLLREALSRSISLFGPELDPAFRATKLPSQYPEWSLTAEQRLEEGTWFSNRHVPFLGALEALPDNVVIHADLVSLLEQGVRKMPHLAPRSLDDLATDSRNQMLIAQWLSHATFRRFDRIAVNTLYAPWATNSAQWHGARTAHSAAEKEMAAVLFGQSHSGAAIHRSIYNAWLSAVRALDPKPSLLSEFRDGRLLIKEHQGIAGRPE